MTYGVVFEGFNRKPLAEILIDIEQGLEAALGPGVQQTAQTPLGQLNGLMAYLIAQTWELNEGVYQSFDADQGEGPRLDMLAKLRRLSRPDGELDIAFRSRITNQGQADVSTTETVNRIKALEGVTWAAVRINDGDTADALGQPAHSVAYAVLGGDEDGVAATVYSLGVGGIRLHGNTEREVVVKGFCQTSRYIRPTEVRIKTEIDVRYLGDACNCAPPSVGTVAQNIATFFASDCQYRNGDVVKGARIKAEAARTPGIEVVEVRIARASDFDVQPEIPTTLFERPVILLTDITVRYVD